MFENLASNFLILLADPKPDSPSADLSRQPTGSNAGDERFLNDAVDPLCGEYRCRDFGFHRETECRDDNQVDGMIGVHHRRV